VPAVWGDWCQEVNLADTQCWSGLSLLTARSSRPSQAGFARLRFPRRFAPRRRLIADVRRLNDMATILSTLSSTSEWKPIDLPVLQDPLSSGIRELARDHWPQWATSSTKFNRIWMVSGDAGRNLGSTAPSTAIRGALLTERIDQKDDPKIYNYNVYLIAETTDGRHFQSGPIAPSEPTHHSSSPSTWFEGLGSPLR